MDISGTTDLKILHLYTGTHEQVFEVEQYAHLELEEYYHHESKWTVETFHKESYATLLNLLDEAALEEVPTVSLQTEVDFLKGELK